MPIKQISTFIAAACLLGVSWHAHAITLNEYGITPTSNGFIDNQSGLRWLSPDLTFGTTAVVDDYLEKGWRIATTSQVGFLLNRNSGGSSGLATASDLFFTEFLALLNLMGAQQVGSDEYFTPWLCRNYGDIDAQCGSTSGGYFERFWIFGVEPNNDNGDILNPTTSYTAVGYLSEAFLYSTYEMSCDTCTGTSFLVRPVPLPAAIWGFLAGLGLLASFRAGSGGRRD